MITGNKGEWSEIYAFLRLLGEGKLVAADENLNRLNEIYFPIIKIIREEIQGTKYEYSTGKDVEIWLDKNIILTLPSEIFSFEADNLFQEIASSGGSAGSFSLERTEAFIKQIHITRLAAPSADKSDININLHDINTGYEMTVGFSIKSELGSSPTLLNAGRTTNFIFRVTNLPETLMDEINNITSGRKIKDRLDSIINNGGVITFDSTENLVFENNLIMIDSQMPLIISNMLLSYFKGTSTSCEDLLNNLIEVNPVSQSPTFYRHKIKEFLCAVALGMKPGTAWDGTDDATGGYIVVKADGDVLAYHIYNRDSFRGYLLKNTKFESASSSRHGYGSLYMGEEGMFLKLNLQIRFV